MLLYSIPDRCNGLLHRMNQMSHIRIIVMFVILFLSIVGFGGDMKNDASLIKITVLFNNLEFDTRLRTKWGFSCLIEGLEKTILFDTNGLESLLRRNSHVILYLLKSFSASFKHIIKGYGAKVEEVNRPTRLLDRHLPIATETLKELLKRSWT